MDVLLPGVWTSIHRNTDGNFSTPPLRYVPSTGRGQAIWGDYDNDGDLDFLVAGASSPSLIAEIYRNDNGLFTNTLATLTGVRSCSLAWGDYDNDGDLDILLAGVSTNGVATRVYRNDKGVFVDSGADLPGISDGSVAWGDYDNDRDLDILIAGNGVTRIYRNDARVPNAPPTTPTGLVASTGSSSLSFSWDAASDAQTSTPGLTYNLRVGLTPGGSEIVSAHANPLTGRRHLPQMGNMQLTTHHTLKNMLAGIYYWSVQTVDAGFMGSSFADEQVIALGAAAPRIYGITMQSDRDISLQSTGIPTFSYTIEASTDLIHWLTLTNLVAGTDGWFEVLDAHAGKYATRFYRVVSGAAGPQ